jgi:hypothetical protein
MISTWIGREVMAWIAMSVFAIFVAGYVVGHC